MVQSKSIWQRRLIDLWNDLATSSSNNRLIHSCGFYWLPTGNAVVTSNDRQIGNVVEVNSTIWQRGVPIIGCYRFHWLELATLEWMNSNLRQIGNVAVQWSITFDLIDSNWQRCNEWIREFGANWQRCAAIMDRCLWFNWLGNAVNETDCEANWQRCAAIDSIWQRCEWVNFRWNRTTLHRLRELNYR